MSKAPVKEYIDAGTTEAAPAAKMRKAPARRIGGKVANIGAAKAKRDDKPAPPPVTGNLERDTLTTMFYCLALVGFASDIAVFDGKAIHACADAGEAVGRALAANEATIMLGNGKGSRHGIFIVPGSGVDIIGNWSFDDGDADGFGAAMDAIESALVAPAAAAA